MRYAKRKEEEEEYDDDEDDERLIISNKPVIGGFDFIDLDKFYKKKSEFKDNDKLIWVLVVLFIPVIGSIIYFTKGKKSKLK